MIETILSVVVSILSIALIAVVLLQEGSDQGMGALAADLLMDQDAMEMAQAYMQLSEADRYAVRLVIASMASKEKKTDARASVVEVEESFDKA